MIVFELDKIRKKLWWAVALGFVLILVLLLPLQMEPLPLNLDTWWVLIFGLALAVDALHGFKIDSFLVFAYRVKGILAKIGNTVILLVGSLLFISSVVELVS